MSQPLIFPEANFKRKYLSRSFVLGLSLVECEALPDLTPEGGQRVTTSTHYPVDTIIVQELKQGKWAKQLSKAAQKLVSEHNRLVVYWLPCAFETNGRLGFSRRSAFETGAVAGADRNEFLLAFCFWWSGWAAI